VWAPPYALVDNNAAIIGVMNDISPQILAVVEGFLPSLVLLIFISITKPIIELLYSHQGESSYSRIEWMTMATYWGFLIFNVFLVSTIGGAILKVILFRGFALCETTTTQPCVVSCCWSCRVVCGLQVLDDFIDNPRSIINLLASSLPQQSGFFINYLLIAGTKKDPQTLHAARRNSSSLCHRFAHLLPRLWSSPAEALPAARTRPAHLHHHPLQARHRTRGAHASPVTLVVVWRGLTFFSFFSFFCRRRSSTAQSRSTTRSRWLRSCWCVAGDPLM
jgi:hypothetical protein